MVKEFPDKDPHVETLRGISMPIGVSFALIVMLVMYKMDLAQPIFLAWKPEWVEGGKYNPLAPSSVLALIAWFSTSKILNWYYKKPIKLEELKSYYLPFNRPTKEYDTHGRFLGVFIMFIGFLAVILYLKLAWLGIFLSLLPFIGYEIWIRYEFEWKVRSQKLR